jgi:glycosyltransferase involved in cell wall biosynthesis
MKKYSIIIPTYNHLSDCLRPCIDSIIQYTDLTEVEVIIVANGCTDGTRDYVADLQTKYPNDIRLVWIDEPAGYTQSTNVGIRVASGEYLILLNNDTMLLKQEKSAWINTLTAPFLADASVGITGPMKNHCPHAKRDFIVFFCAMIKRSVLEELAIYEEKEDSEIVCKNA